MPGKVDRFISRIYLPVVVGNILATLNMGAISVAMPFLTQSLGISPEQGLALPAAYLIGLLAAAILSGYLVQRHGERTTLSLAIVGLISTNVLAILFADNFIVLTGLVLCQGVCAGPFPPITQRLIALNFPADKRAPRMALWQGGLTAGVVIGSVGGGYLISELGLQWVFSMAPLLGIAGLGIVLKISNDEKNNKVPFDALSFVLLLVVVIALTVVLELGRHLGWLSSNLIVGLMIAGVASAVGLRWSLSRDHGRMVDLSVLGNRDLAIGIAMVLVFFGIGTGHLQNQMLVWVFGFGPDAIAQRLGFGGPVRLLGVLVCGLLTLRYEVRQVMLVALCTVLVGKLGYLMWAPGLTQVAAVLPFAIDSFGSGMFMVCLATMAYQSLGKTQLASAAILYVLAQRLGGSVGLAMLGAAEAQFQTSLSGADFSAAQAQGAAFLGVSWIEFMLVLPLLLGTFLFGKLTHTGKAKVP